MIAERPLSELTQDAIRILYRELGVVETVRFLRQLPNGYGNYMAEREALLGHKSLTNCSPRSNSAVQPRHW